MCEMPALAKSYVRKALGHCNRSLVTAVVSQREAARVNTADWASFIIIIITSFSCLEARCVCRQAAVKAAKILPLVGLARSKQAPINRRHGAQYLYRPPPAKAKSLIIFIITIRYSCQKRQGASCRQAASKGCQMPTPCWTRQIQARPNQPWARCSVIVPPPASKGPV